MKISFKQRKLRDLTNNDRVMKRARGALRAKKLRLRLTQLEVATTLEDVRHLAGRYHALTGDRKGQWSCDLDHPYRLILSPSELPIPVNGDGQFIWSEIRSVVVIEIVDYHNEG